MVTVSDRPFSKKADAQSGTIGYLAFGEATDDADEVIAAVLAVAPETYAGLPRQTPSIEEAAVDVDGAPLMWRVDVPYGRIRSQRVQPTGAVVWNGDTTGGTSHKTTSLNATTYTDASGVPVGAAHNTMIGADKDSVKGVDIHEPQDGFTATKYVPAAAFASLRESLFDLTGTVNDAPFSADGFTYAAGEVLFLGATWTKRTTMNPIDYEVNFRFAAQPNVEDVFIGDSEILYSKKGWEYLDVRFQSVVANSDDPFATVTQRPILVNIHQVYPDGDFSLLGL